MIRGAAAGLCVFVAGGCFASEPHAPPPVDEALALLEELRADEYTSWARPGDYNQRTSGRGPHGSYVDVYLDPVLESALTDPEQDDAQVWPEGSTVVCEGRDGEQDNEPAVISVAARRNGAWFWAQFGSDDRVVVSGPAHACAGCHGAGDDFLRSVRLP